MKTLQAILSTSLLAISLSAGANDAMKPNANIPSLESLNILSVAPCKASGDGTFTEMVTTMASVLSAAEADALLARYCDACNKQKFAAARVR